MYEYVMVEPAEEQPTARLTHINLLLWSFTTKKSKQASEVSLHTSKD